MKFTAYVIEKNGKFWSRTASRWLDSPADGCTYATAAEAQKIALTSGWSEEKSSKVSISGRLYNVGRDIQASPPGVVQEISIEVKG